MVTGDVWAMINFIYKNHPAVHISSHRHFTQSKSKELRVTTTILTIDSFEVTISRFDKPASQTNSLDSKTLMKQTRTDGIAGIISTRHRFTNS